MEASVAKNIRAMTCATCGDMDAADDALCPDCGVPMEPLLGACLDCGDDTREPKVTQCNGCAAYHDHVDAQIDARDLDDR